MAFIPYIMVFCLIGYVNSENATILEAGDTCDPRDIGPWSALLEEWAITAPVHSERHGRIMALPTGNGYYVTERIDGPFAPPPPPPTHMPSSVSHMHPPGPHMSSGPHMSPGPHGPPRAGHVPQNYNEWEASPPPATSKIVNRPPNPYKDKFKPSYQVPPTAGQTGARPARPGAADRVDEPPRKQVSETDLYLLGAIEKLVYRVDLMEKRLRKAEESLHYLVVGTETKPEPCPGNFTRVGSGCYQWSREAADWKGASVSCRRQRGALLELPDRAQRRVLVAKLLADQDLKGNDFWTGGLNPGLLWIWSHSARPLDGNGTGVAGAGRCLALAHDAAARDYALRGRDCAAPHRYICQRDDDAEQLGNDVQKAARSLSLDRPRKAGRSEVLWDDV
ncbi:uncharacterized protein [Epargyreus clarus]|uniref:uncharacterized protein n=1 Tax=Epargyreus clarus TaxID=520877 RepID=UPI003C2B4353